MNNKPIAWHYPDGKPDQCTTDKEYAEKDPAWTPMYYKHEWVGLTKEDMPNGDNPMFDHEYFIAGMVYAANILMDKNT